MNENNKEVQEGRERMEKKDKNMINKRKRKGGQKEGRKTEMREESGRDRWKTMECDVQ